MKHDKKLVSRVILTVVLLSLWRISGECRRVVSVYSRESGDVKDIVLLVSLTRWFIFVVGTLILFLFRDWRRVFLIALVVILIQPVVSQVWRPQPVKFIIQNHLHVLIILFLVIDEVSQRVWLQFQTQLEKLRYKQKWVVFLVATLMISIVFTHIWNALTRMNLVDTSYMAYWGQVFVMSMLAYILYFVWSRVGGSLVRESRKRLRKKIGLLWGAVVVAVLSLLVYSTRARQILIGPIERVSSYTPKQLLYLYCINLIEEIYLCQTHSMKWERKQRPFLSHRFIKNQDQWEILISKDTANIQKRNKVLLDILQAMFSDTDKEKMIKIVDACLIHDRNFNVLGCATISENNVVFIFLRGTNNIWEWAGNIGGAVHTFSPTDLSTKHVEINAVAHSMYDFLFSFLSKSREKTKIVISGHSRGAIIALYLALQMMRRDPKPSYHLALFAVPPLTDIETYLSFIRSSKNMVEVLLHQNDVLGWVNELYPLLTSFCPSYGHQAQVSNYILRSEKKNVPSKNRLAFIRFDPQFKIEQRDAIVKKPIILHDLSDYILSSFV